MQIFFYLFLSASITIIFLHGTAFGFGSMGTISAAFGENGFFCAIDASGKQSVICWGANTSSTQSSSSSSPFTDIPPMAALSGGEGFLCGILSNTSQAYCWSNEGTADDLVPPNYQSTAYSHIAAGKSHVCAVRGSYYSDHDLGTVDCWEIVRTTNQKLTSVSSALFYDQSVSNLVFNRVVSGEGFSCGAVRDGGVVCWGPNSQNLGISEVTDQFPVLASGKASICGIHQQSSEINCWGDNNSFAGAPAGTKFVSLTAGARHFCGIRQDNHEVECWGNYNHSQVPKSSGFMAIASSDSTVCGTRESDLILDCWFSKPNPNSSSSESNYDPPLELSSPGLCTPRPCNSDEFAFNASILNEAELTSLCVRRDLKICSPCGLTCPEGSFLSSPCTSNADRLCTPCSLCQNSSCSSVCGIKDLRQKHSQQMRNLIIIVASSASGFLVLLLCACIWISQSAAVAASKKKELKSTNSNCNDEEHQQSLASTPSVGTAQVFRLLELKDATNGFKEFNELGRGSYGFVYKAVLSDGQQVAVKRANAATIIHSNSREFEMELEILCKIRHCNIVNLLGYCSEMGERLLVYEYMPHGTLHDHLHGGLTPLNWSMRLKIAMNAAKGLEYLHREMSPPIVHRHVKTSNILLDSEWGARIADFGLVSNNSNNDLKGDVYDFGIVLLEILSGRKAYDIDYSPANIVEWGVPLIRKGKGAAIIDRYVALPRNVEPLLKLADMAELALRENPNDRPPMSEIASWLDQIVKDGLIL